MADSSLRRPFGDYILTAQLGHDALGPVFRALRVSGDPGFARLRILESPEISEDAVLDAIEENGEIHSFLKNPAVARGVQMDAVEGTPFLAWNEPNGRTLDDVILKARVQHQGIPVEHALLIGEKVATALEHAYNTTLDGERTLHGLVWPGFVSISDDGETRLTGFGLATGFFPSMSRPRFAREIAPYLAPEERAHLAIQKNSDVYSVGVLLFELLFGRLPSPTDPLGDVKAAGLQSVLSPEVMTVLRTCLAPADSRYQSSGDLRRELGKILFSGPYSPSTFNLAFFITSLFGSEIEAETLARAREAAGDTAIASPAPRPPASPAVAQRPAPAPRPPVQAQSAPPPPSSRRRSYAIGGSLLLAAAVAGTVLMITRRPASERHPAAAPARPAPAATPIVEPTSPPTTAMSEGQFKEEVARRVASELKRLEEDFQKSKGPAQPGRPLPSGRAAAPAEPPQRVSEPATAPAPSLPRKQPPAEPSPAPADARSEPGLTEAAATPVPTPPPAAEPRVESPQAGPAEPETPPAIRRIVKPVYPEFALRARIKGIVVLRVLVNEKGSPEQIQVLKGVGGGLSEAAVSAVRRWTFEPARQNGQPVAAWTTIPIPFEP